MPKLKENEVPSYRLHKQSGHAIMIRLGRCRTSINTHAGRIRRVFKWAVEYEMVPPSVHYGLISRSHLRAYLNEQMITPAAARPHRPLRP